MNKFLRFSVVLVALLVLSPALSVFAQGGDPVCNGLTASDCQIVTGSSAAMANVTSFSVPAFAIDLSLSAMGENIAFSAMGSGHIMLPTDPTNLFAGLLIHLVIDQASIFSPDTNQSGSAEVLIKGNMAYIKVDGEWYGEEITAEDLGELETLLEGGVGAATGQDIGIDLTNVITTARGADVGNVAVFATRVDINQLLMAVLTSPLVGEALGEDMGMPPEQLQMVGMILGPMLTGTSISVEQWIDTGSLMLVGVKLDVVLALDASMIDPSIGKIDGAINFLTEIADFNGTFDVPAPASYQPMENLDLDF